MEEVRDTTNDEYGQRANWLVCSLETFESVFGLTFGHLLFDAAEQLSRTIQAKDTSQRHNSTRSNSGRNLRQEITTPD